MAGQGGALAPEVDVAIVGAGFSGLGMAIRLQQEGRDDFLIFERADDVGGTWHWNTYPGCACDVPSHLYSLSFAPKADWSRTYALQPEIRDYLQATADSFGVRPKIRFRCEVEEARWDDDAGRWVVRTSDGEVRARVLVAAAGPLFEPQYPQLPGIDTFKGKAFHSSRWDHDDDLRGKRVAAIGTGASAIQFVPEIQPDVEQLHVFQRTPPWVMPHTARDVTAVEKKVYGAMPALRRAARGFVYSAREMLVLGFVKQPRLMNLVEKIARKHISDQVPDPELRKKVTPGYTIGCKRILPSNKWYPALGSDNVELVTGGAQEVREHSIVGADGVEREVDAIIYGTGFHVSDMPIAEKVHGRGGDSLAEIWQGSPRALLGTTVPGFPNLFFLLGPSTGGGHSSVVYMSESQMAYVLDALRAMDERGAAAVEPKRAALEAFDSEVDRRMAGTVWSTGCKSWYFDATGRNSLLWPDWTWRFRRRTARFNPGQYLARRA